MLEKASKQRFGEFNYLPLDGDALAGLDGLQAERIGDWVCTRAQSGNTGSRGNGSRDILGNGSDEGNQRGDGGERSGEETHFELLSVDSVELMEEDGGQWGRNKTMCKCKQGGLGRRRSID